MEKTRLNVNHIVYAISGTVIVAGVASIVSVTSSIYLEWQKSKWRGVLAEVNRIHEKAGNLSLSLAKFRNPVHLKNEGIDLTERINLRANHDAWELAVCMQLKEDERNVVREMRKNCYGWNHLTKGKSAKGEVAIMYLIDNVVELSSVALERLSRYGKSLFPWS